MTNDLLIKEIIDYHLKICVDKGQNKYPDEIAVEMADPIRTLMKKLVSGFRLIVK